jgi:KDO2-lipid IV(A) lauroyltransferase
MKHRPKHLVEYVLLRGLFGAVNLLPLQAALSLGEGIGAFFFFVLRYRRADAEARIRQVFGNRYSEKECRKIAWHSFRNICFNAVEAARFHRMTPEQMRRMPIYQAIEQVHRANRENGPLIIATIHMGNWDLAGVASKLDGMPIFSIARRQKNPLTDELLNRMRNATGMEVVLNDSRVLQNVVRQLKQGGVLAILPDVRSRESDVTVNFLNGRASLGPGTAIFAQMARCPIYPVVITRTGRTVHHARVFDPVAPDPTLDKKEDRQRIMQELMNIFSAAVQEHPDQYFWFNKRWVLNPA